MFELSLDSFFLPTCLGENYKSFWGGGKWHFHIFLALLLSTHQLLLSIHSHKNNMTKYWKEYIHPSSINSNEISIWMLLTSKLVLVLSSLLSSLKNLTGLPTLSINASLPYPNRFIHTLLQC